MGTPQRRVFQEGILCGFLTSAVFHSGAVWGGGGWWGERGWWRTPHAGGELGELETRAPDGGLRRRWSGGGDVRWEGLLAPFQGATGVTRLWLGGGPGVLGAAHLHPRLPSVALPGRGQGGGRGWAGADGITRRVMSTVLQGGGRGHAGADGITRRVMNTVLQGGGRGHSESDSSSRPGGATEGSRGWSEERAGTPGDGRTNDVARAAPWRGARNNHSLSWATPIVRLSLPEHRPACGKERPCTEGWLRPFSRPSRAGGARGRTGPCWGGRHHSESDEYCTVRRRTEAEGFKVDGVSPSGLGMGARGKVGRIVPMRSGVEPGGGRGMRWEFRETRNSARKMRALHGGRGWVSERHHSESDEYCTGAGGRRPRGGCGCLMAF